MTGKIAVSTARFERSFIQNNHNATVRDYLTRYIDNKPEKMKIARLYDYDFWDGDRSFGYGGHIYRPGYWTDFVSKIQKCYHIDSSSSVYDLGCGKGYILKEFYNLTGCTVSGSDISDYAIHNCHEDVKNFVSVSDCVHGIDACDKAYSLCICINVLHNLRLQDIVSTLREITRVSKSQYIVVEAFDDEESQHNLYGWALTANTLISTKDWLWIFDQAGYFGDYEFIFFR